MRYLLDIDTCIYAMKGRDSVLHRMSLWKPQDIGVSAIVEAELRTGAAKSLSAVKAQRTLEHFLSPLVSVEFDSADARIYARVRAQLEKAGTPIGPVDGLIAAQALVRKLTLVTNNEREYRRVAGLKVENWSKSANHENRLRHLRRESQSH